MKVEKRKPEDIPQCPYCNAHNPSYTEMSSGRHQPSKGDVSICLMCSGVALFTGDGVLTRRPTFEEKHSLLGRPDVIGGISFANHFRNHHM